MCQPEVCQPDVLVGIAGGNRSKAAMLAWHLQRNSRQVPAITPLKVMNKKSAKDNERPLVEDIRLLGRILGDVVKEQ